MAGATTRYRLLWMALFTMPLLVAVQSMAARIGACKEEGLGRVIEARFGRKVLIGSVVVLLVANTATHPTTRFLETIPLEHAMYVEAGCAQLSESACHTTGQTAQAQLRRGPSFDIR